MALGDILLRDGTMERDVSCDRLQITRQMTECDGQNGIARKKNVCTTATTMGNREGHGHGARRLECDSTRRRQRACANYTVRTMGTIYEGRQVLFSFFFIRRANIRMELTSEEVREHLVLE